MHADFFKLIESLGLRHFTADELLVNTKSVRGGVRNSIPDRSLWHNIIPTIIVLDELRHRMGAPITLNSVYRNPQYNDAVVGSPRSQHQDFRAIDFKCEKGTPSEWAAILIRMRGARFQLPTIEPVGVHAPFKPDELDIKSGFVFAGGIGIYPTFVHLDTRGENANF